ncbi:PAQR family membrane homeostasis protein TrhA [Yunchengibacter salinarum]|uniref:PAQR family membrane homeostasis protein TrhA n=1 Tax=Yunchengibacter salinarum TaxID=3133399 RepID=UPI0035B668B8
MSTVDRQPGGDTGLTPEYSLAEEVTHAVTHGVGALAALVGGIALVVQASQGAGQGGGVLPIAAVSIYAICMVAMFAASTLYHSLAFTRHHAFFKLLDHVAIYFKIAGTYTPFALITLPLGPGLAIMGGVWGAAFTGLAFKVRRFLSDRRGSTRPRRFSPVSLALYLVMGWAAVFVIDELYVRLSASGFMWLVLGGAFYTIGAIFYALKRVPYAHAIWHLFVLAGSASHFVAIYGIV